MLASTRKDIAKSIKTLLVMLQTLKDQQVTITLRNDSIVCGTVIKVDAEMNIELKNAHIEPDQFYCTQPADSKQVQTHTAYDESNVSIDKETESEEMVTEQSESEEDDEQGDENDSTGKLFDYLLVKGSRIRHIDMPVADCDLLANTKQEIERIRNRHKQWTKHDIIR